MPEPVIEQNKNVHIYIYIFVFLRQMKKIIYMKILKWNIKEANVPNLPQWQITLLLVDGVNS